MKLRIDNDEARGIAALLARYAFLTASALTWLKIGTIVYTIGSIGW